ncbi:alternative ribosome rescue aminoacyl-tRNA hydrolase ArfB [Winogradskyella aurantiaca]|uniref:alternative ribosome rescue aminoacyl-tRNA hydrolase ArfB n=1 Tax=Winogradskyella aurantiaca TaxID=2219558 RepID=UPI002937194E|nr:alternative ribosome rescue aminoacyl-tRNA hydrolase ArfB [Winogradskyella aurantiaca]
MILDKKGIGRELKFKAIRSSGSGGQHVNKVATKVELSFDLQSSLFLSVDQKQKLIQTYASMLSKEGVLRLSSGKTRSQLRNKELVTQRLFDLLEAGLKTQKKRKSTTVPRAVKRKRQEDKRRHSDKKSSRKPPKIG